MDNNKKLTIKRLIIYYVIAMIPGIIGSIIAYNVCGRGVWTRMDEPIVYIATTLLGLGMFTPALSNILTRLITKEGFKNSYLAWTAKKGNIRYFVMSIVIKPIEAIAGAFPIYALYLNGMEFSSGGDKTIEVSAIVLQLAYSVYIFFPAFGEEWGWRGYMMPKLMELMPKPAALIVGGVLWGLWHAPLTVNGHNFGMDYPGFPWLGILLMCVFCTMSNIVLTFLTERTKSIYPASFCHMINNNIQPILFVNLFFGEQAVSRLDELSASPVSMMLVLTAAESVMCVVCFVLMCREGKRKKAGSEA